MNQVAVLPDNIVTTPLSLASTKQFKDDVQEAEIPEHLKDLVVELKAQFLAASLSPSAGVLNLPAVDCFSIKDLLQQYAKKSRQLFSEWAKYCHFSDVHYTRNLIYACEDFELVVLCWGPGILVS